MARAVLAQRRRIHGVFTPTYLTYPTPPSSSSKEEVTSRSTETTRDYCNRKPSSPYFQRSVLDTRAPGVAPQRPELHIVRSSTFSCHCQLSAIANRTATDTSCKDPARSVMRTLLSLSHFVIYTLRDLARPPHRYPIPTLSQKPKPKSAAQRPTTRHVRLKRNK